MKGWPFTNVPWDKARVLHAITPEWHLEDGCSQNCSFPRAAPCRYRLRTLWQADIWGAPFQFHSWLNWERRVKFIFFPIGGDLALQRSVCCPLVCFVVVLLVFIYIYISRMYLILQRGKSVFLYKTQTRDSVTWSFSGLFVIITETTPIKLQWWKWPNKYKIVMNIPSSFPGFPDLFLPVPQHLPLF